MIPKAPPLVDSFGRTHHYLRVSVTDRCNLRCSYCYPTSVDRRTQCRETLGFAGITRLVRLFARMGMDKVRLTGGEPLMRENLEQLVEQIVHIPGIKTVGMTTNGVLLKEKLEVLKEAGLSSLNVSLDTLRPERFARITGRDQYHRVHESLDKALDEGFSPLKLNTVIIRGFNDDELLDFVDLACRAPIRVRFIEYMPFNSNLWRNEDIVSWSQMREIIERRYRLYPLREGPEKSAVAREYAIEGFSGRVGFIAPLSSGFCEHCSRLRLTADGHLKLCLHHPQEIDLASALGAGFSDEQLADMIYAGLKEKPEAHEAGGGGNLAGKRTMAETGG